MRSPSHLWTAPFPQFPSQRVLKCMSGETELSISDYVCIPFSPLLPVNGMGLAVWNSCLGIPQDNALCLELEAEINPCLPWIVFYDPCLWGEGGTKQQLLHVSRYFALESFLKVVSKSFVYRFPFGPWRSNVALQEFSCKLEGALGLLGPRWVSMTFNLLGVISLDTLWHLLTQHVKIAKRIFNKQEEGVLEALT